MRLFFLLGLALSMALTAGAQTVLNLTIANLTANGWTTTATSVYGGSTDASITEVTDSGVNGFRFYTGPMNTAWQFQWAGVSTEAFANVKLADVTSVKIRNYGVSGFNLSNWQPATFTWVVNRGDGNQRCISWKPWANGNIRAPGMWNEYDAAVTGQWHVYETGANYNSLADLKAAMPSAWFEPTANLPLAYGYASQHAFNVGNCPLYDEDRAWFSDSRSYVDWFEVGVNGNVTRYDLGPIAVPEPGSLALLGAGIIGLLALRKRK